MAEVVFIDDERALVRFFVRLMRRCRIEAAAFEDPREALAYIERNGDAVRLVVSDYRMPALTGLDVLNRLPASLRARFVIITGELVDSDFTGDDRIAAVIRKPIGPNDLLVAIRRELEFARAEHG